MMMRTIQFDAKKLLFLSLTFILLSLGLIGLAALGLDIPVLRQIVLFVFLTFFPGTAILRILKISRIGILQSVVYSAGLSIVFTMLIGLLANLALPYLGVASPISLIFLMIILTLFNVIVSVWAYKRDKDFCIQLAIPGIDKILTPQRGLALTLPMIAVLGARLLTLYQNNLLLLFFIVAVFAMVVWLSLSRLQPKEYPLVVFMIAVSLLLHASLISDQLWGWDIHTEYYFQNLVRQNGYWDLSLTNSYNSTLSVVMLGPLYSIFLNMDAIWVFKIVYPIIFALVPLTLFQIFREQIGNKRAFLAVFFFMAANTFFTEMIQLARQEVAELFFALLILAFISAKLTSRQRLSLLFTFSLGLIVSHYALGYLGLAFIIGGWVIASLIKSKIIRAVRRQLGGYSSGGQSLIVSARVFLIISIVYVVFTVGWYGTIAKGSALNEIIRVAGYQHYVLSTEISQPPTTDSVEANEISQPPTTDSVESNEISQPLKTGFFDPREKEALVFTALGLDYSAASTLGKGFRIFQYITELLIVIGFIFALLRQRGFAFEFLGMAIVSAGILFSCVALPVFSSFLNASRFYHISLFLLAPMLVLGAEGVSDAAFRLINYVSAKMVVKRTRGMINCAEISSIYGTFLLLAVLGPYFLFNTGFLYEVTGFRQQNAFNYPMAFKSDQFSSPVFNKNEVDAVNRAVNEIGENALIYGDKPGCLLLDERFPPDRVGLIQATGIVPDQAYIFLRSWNVHEHEFAVIVMHGVEINLENVPWGTLSALFEDRHIIFSNDDAQIWSPKVN
jgi:uncharacterized membrane protein